MGLLPGVTRIAGRESGILTNLPQAPNSFIGREEQLSELLRLVAETRALTLRGAGGIGKTRLAQRLLAAAADEFPDGVWFVELGDLRQPDLVVPRVASVVGVREEPSRPLLETLAAALRPRRLLLALDNCEHLIDACAHVAQRLLASSPGLRLIATSREPLRIAAETVWPVPPLSVAPDGVAVSAADVSRYEAVRLFADRAAAVLPGFTVSPANAATVAALCRALDSIPRDRTGRGAVRALSVEQISERLDDRFGLLTGGDRTAPPATARCAPPSTGATTCSPAASRFCCGGSRSSPAGRWRWPRRCARTRTSRPRTFSTC